MAEQNSKKINGTTPGETSEEEEEEEILLVMDPLVTGVVILTDQWVLNHFPIIGITTLQDPTILAHSILVVIAINI